MPRGINTSRRAQLVKEWVAANGYVCPGWGREPHSAKDLTADHIQPKAKGGPEEGPMRVLCRSCNSRRGAGRSERVVLTQSPKTVVSPTNLT